MPEPDWATLAAATFVDFPQDWSIRRLNDHAVALAGQRREVALEVNDVHSLLELVQHALGVAIVPRPVAAKDKAAGLLVRDLPAGASMRWQAALAVAGDERVSPAAAELWRTVEAVVRPAPVG